MDSVTQCSKLLKIVKHHSLLLAKTRFHHVATFAKFLIAFFPYFGKRDINILHFSVIRIHFILEDPPYSSVNP